MQDADNCASDTDAQADVAFGAATEAIRLANAATAMTDESIRSLALGEVLLQRSLRIAPLRVESWIWRIRGAQLRGDVAATERIASEAIEQYQLAAKGFVVPALRAVSGLVAIANTFPSSTTEQLLLRSAFHVGATTGPAALDHHFRYRDVITNHSDIHRPRQRPTHEWSTLRHELTERFGAFTNQRDHKHEEL